MAAWPERWCYSTDDLPLGEKIVVAVEPFLRTLVDRGAAETTLRRHFGNVFFLGGDIIRAAQSDSDIQQLTGRELLRRFVDEEGGPFLYENKEEQRLFDATCRKLSRFVSSE